MRWGLVVALVCLACQKGGSDGELSRAQCKDVIQRIDRLESADIGGMHTARLRTQRGSVEACMKRGTRRAHRCVLIAEKVSDLQSCELSWR